MILAELIYLHQLTKRLPTLPPSIQRSFTLFWTIQKNCWRSWVSTREGIIQNSFLLLKLKRISWEQTKEQFRRQGPQTSPFVTTNTVKKERYTWARFHETIIKSNLLHLYILGHRFWLLMELSDWKLWTQATESFTWSTGFLKFLQLLTHSLKYWNAMGTLPSCWLLLLMSDSSPEKQVIWIWKKL